MSNERTFEKDIEDKKLLRAHLLQLVEQVSWRLRQSGLVCRVVRIKIRFSDFKTITRSATLSDPTQSTQNIWKVAAALFDKFVSGNIRPIRLVGFGVSNLDHSTSQQGLFSDSIEPQRKIDCVADQINKRFGAAVLRRGTVIKTSR
jgi:DNA polymerase-4